jgi:hypothetical protein
MSDTISACCHAEIKAHMRTASFYSLSPPEPVPYCTECGATNPDEVEDEQIYSPDELWPCHYCHGEGWIWGDGKKLTCPRCHGRGIEGE